MSTKDGHGRKIQPIAQRSVPAGRPHLVPLSGVNGAEPRMGPSLAGRGASPAVPVCKPEPFLPPVLLESGTGLPANHRGTPGTPLPGLRQDSLVRDLFGAHEQAASEEAGPGAQEGHVHHTLGLTAGRQSRSHHHVPGEEGGGYWEDLQASPGAGPSDWGGWGRWVGLSRGCCWPSAVSIPGLHLPSFVGPLGLCPSACMQLCRELALEDRRNPGREILSWDLRKLTPCDQHTLSTSPCEALFKCLPYS